MLAWCAGPCSSPTLPWMTSMIGWMALPRHGIHGERSPWAGIDPLSYARAANCANTPKTALDGGNGAPACEGRLTAPCLPEPHRGGHGPVRHVARGGDPQADPARRYLIIDSCVCLMAVRAHRYGLHARRTRRRDPPEPAHAAELRRQPAADIMRML